MSFVYDTRLLRELLKIGQADQYEDPETYANKVSMAQRVKTILDALEQQTAPQTPEQKAQDISFQPDPENPNSPAPKYDASSLETLGQLVEWSVKNRITVGGQRIAYASNEQPPSEDYVFYKLEPGYKLEPVTTREVTRLGYFINKDLLVAFINSRLKALHQKPNKVEEFQLNMRIDDANKLLGTSINKQYVEPENPEDTVDNLPQVLDAKNPYQTGQAVPVKLKDLKDVQSLKGLLTRGGITLRDRRGQEFKFDDMGDICAALAILSLRAARLGQGVASGKQKSYIDHVAQLQQQANCGQQQQSGQQQGGAGGQAQLLQQLMTLLPFDSTQISVPEIKKWLDTYSAYANDADVTDKAQSIKDSLDSFVSKSNFGDTIQLTNMDTTMFKSQLKNQADAINMSNYLFDAITQAGSLYSRMLKQLQNLAQDPRFSGAYRQMQQQVTPGGPQLTNRQDLFDLSNNLKREWQQHK